MKDHLLPASAVAVAIFVIAAMVFAFVKRCQREEAVLGRPFRLHHKTYIGIGSPFSNILCVDETGNQIYVNVSVIENVLAASCEKP